MSNKENNTITPTDTIQEVKQKLFDNGYNQLAKQECWSISGFGDDGSAICRYRSEDGSQCFISPSISDDEYSDDLEGHGAHYVDVIDAIKNSGIPITQTLGDFLFCMQSECHDLPASGEFTLEPARQFAKEHGLTIPEIEGVV